MPDIVSTQSLIDLNPDSFVDLFEIYISESVGVLRFHAGKNFAKPIVYKGKNYTPVPIEYSGFEFSADGKQNRPTIRVANINGVITDVIKNKNDLVNSKLKRIKLFIKNLDDENFSEGVNPFFGFRKKRNAVSGYGSPFFEESYIINRKVSENKYVIEFELSSPLDYENQTLPNRKISDNLCSFCYRGCGCNYGKIPWKNGSNQPQTIPVTNSSNKLVSLSESDIWGTTQTINGETIPKLNLGFPVADENDKLFYSVNGYGLTTPLYRGFWNKNTTYSAGDFVTFSDSVNYNFFGESFQFSEDNVSYSIYVCILGGESNKDPRYNKEYWVKDSCSQSIKGCKLRWNGHKDGLPYGGFPGTRPYNYQV